MVNSNCGIPVTVAASSNSTVASISFPATKTPLAPCPVPERVTPATPGPRASAPAPLTTGPRTFAWCSKVISAALPALSAIVAPFRTMSVPQG